MDWQLICKLIVVIDIIFATLTVYFNIDDGVRNAVGLLVILITINIFGVLGGMYK